MNEGIKEKITEDGFYPAMEEVGSNADFYIIEYDSIKGGLFWGNEQVEQEEFCWIGEKINVKWPGVK